MSALNHSHLTGTCLSYCPDQERQNRIQSNQINDYEIPPLQCLKEFQRGVDKDITPLDDIRPPVVLLAAINYLIITNNSFITRDRAFQPAFYLFLWDRCKAIIKDIILQSYGCGGRLDSGILICIECYELIVRLFIRLGEQLSLKSTQSFNQFIDNITMTSYINL